MKKIVFILITSFILAVIFFLAYQFLFNLHSQKGALQVTSAPEGKVFLNNKYLGQTPLCKCEAGDMLDVGKYTIRLVPFDKNLPEFQEKIEISGSVLTVVDRKFGKNALSEGSIISLTPLSDKGKIELLVVSFPQGSTVILDDNIIGTTPILFKDVTESDHVLKVKKTGYKEKTVRIRTPVGYKLTVAAYLSTSTALVTSSPGASVSASVTPSVPVADTPSPTSVGNVVILDTPTGFLRVREGASVGSKEIAQVSPGESYPVVDEQTGWYQIKLHNGISGWVSSQYAAKQ
jgi:hypothetical protein